MGLPLSFRRRVRVPVPADSLQKGFKLVVTGDRLDTLEEICPHYTPTIVFEIVFNPDEPVEAFVEPPMQILTMGQEASSSRSFCARTRTRRSGMHLRGCGQGNAPQSAPDT